jgi:hypothetical protein
MICLLDRISYHGLCQAMIAIGNIDAIFICIDYREIVIFLTPLYDIDCFCGLHSALWWPRFWLTITISTTTTLPTFLVLPSCSMPCLFFPPTFPTACPYLASSYHALYLYVYLLWTLLIWKNLLVLTLALVDLVAHKW